MRRFLPIIFFILSLTSYAQPGFIWTKQMGAANVDNGYAITTDEEGNIYITGSFEDTVDFDPGVGVYNLISSTGNIFITKFDAAGNFLWAKKLNLFTYSLLHIAVDSSGVYVLGARNYFLSKFDLSGNYLWTKQLAGWMGNYGASIVLDINGNIYITGTFRGTTDFDFGAGVYNLTAQGDGDIFILKLDSSGNFIWVKQIGGPDSGLASSDDGSAIALDAIGNVIVAGRFYDTVDFDPGAGVK